jgi:hypothetical protein
MHIRSTGFCNIPLLIDKRPRPEEATAFTAPLRATQLTVASFNRSGIYIQARAAAIPALPAESAFLMPQLPATPRTSHSPRWNFDNQHPITSQAKPSHRQRFNLCQSCNQFK